MRVRVMRCVCVACNAPALHMTRMPQLLELVPALAPYKKIIDDIIKGARAFRTLSIAVREFVHDACRVPACINLFARA